MSKLFGLPGKCVEDIRAVLAAVPTVERAVIFGSRALGTYRPGSDVDLALFGNVSYDDLLRIKTRLDDIPWAYLYDVVVYDQITNPAVRAHIDDLGLNFYERKSKKKTGKAEQWDNYLFSEFVSINPQVKLLGEGPFSFVEMRDLNDGQRTVYPSSKRKLAGGARFANGDTLFARITPCLENGKISQVKGLNEVGFGSTEFLVFRGKKGISDNDFIYYLSRLDEVRRFAEQNMVGTSGRQRVSKDAFENLELLLPPLPTQRRIAAILTALDDKIELNRQMNHTLERLAGAVWQEWFGGYQEGDALPKGWRWGTILEIANLIGGGTPKTETKEYWNGDIPWISGKDITPNNRSIIIETEKQISVLGLENSSAKLLPIFSTVISARGTVGNFCLIPRPMTISQSNYALKARIQNTDFFLFQQVQNIISEMQQRSYGTVFDTITTKTFSEIEIPIPTVLKMTAFDAFAKPIFQQRIENLTQTRTLTALRDTLLPQLMRGELVV